MATINNEADWDDDTAVIQTVIGVLSSVVSTGLDDTEQEKSTTRKKRTKFKYNDALQCVMRDYLGPYPIFNDKQFDVMFRVSRSRFQRLLDDFGNSNDEFYVNNNFHNKKNKQSSLECKLLLPLKTRAYGVAPHTFCDYFQMSIEFSREVCKKFDQTINNIYKHEYLWLPTKINLKTLTIYMRMCMVFKECLVL